MSDIKKEEVFVDIVVLTDNTKKLIEKTESIAQKLKSLKDSALKLSTYENEETNDLCEQLGYVISKTEQLLQTHKRVSREYDYALSTYKETEHKSKDIINAITF